MWRGGINFFFSMGWLTKASESQLKLKVQISYLESKKKKTDFPFAKRHLRTKPIAYVAHQNLYVVSKIYCLSDACMCVCGYLFFFYYHLWEQSTMAYHFDFWSYYYSMPFIINDNKSIAREKEIGREREWDIECMPDIFKCKFMFIPSASHFLHLQLDHITQ